MMLSMRDRLYHHGDLRASLLEQAERVLQDKGAAALSLRELARDLGVSHAAPHRHFKDRRALLDALAFVGFDRLTTRLTEADPGPGGEFSRRLAAVAHAAVDFAVREPDLMALMFSRKHDTDAGDEMDKAWERLGAPLFAVIAHGQQTGEVHAGDIHRITVAAFAAVHGVASLAAVGMLPKDEIPRTLDDTLAHLIKGLSA
jgi:AcrR family transcriptional regulator